MNSRALSGLFLDNSLKAFLSTLKSRHSVRAITRAVLGNESKKAISPMTDPCLIQATGIHFPFAGTSTRASPETNKSILVVMSP